MIVELGHYAMILALVLVLLQGSIPVIGALSGRHAWMLLAQPLVWLQSALLLLAWLALCWAFVSHDFSVAYVALHSSLDLPLHYRISAVWGGHEGSMLLWVLMLSLWSAAVAGFGRRLPLPFLALAIGVLGWVSAGFLGFTLFTSNPFERLLPPPLDGSDLNPLLQDPGMIFHPPLLYMGYVGFAVTFAFAIAALIQGRLEADWARWCRPWAVLSWVFMTLGIALGSWWAYYELGWGGWWFWDPVENASLMPWLSGTALIHSLAVADKRGGFRIWTLMLAIITFALTLLGAFLVRSGVITSVHAFATDPSRGTFILALLALTLIGSLSLYAWRAPRVAQGPNFAVLSRESLLLANNVLLIVACATVLLGTLYPMALDSLGLAKISVGPPYFELVFPLIMLPLLLLLGIGPMLRWGKHEPGALGRRVGWLVLAALLIGSLWPLLMGGWGPLLALSLVLASWIGLSVFQDLYDRWRRRLSLPPARIGMHLAHLGVAVFVVGVAMVMRFEIERDLRLAPGQTAEVAGYHFSFDAIEQVEGPNYLAHQGRFSVTTGEGRHITSLLPEKRRYHLHEMPMTQASLHRGLWRDLYVSLGEPLNDSGNEWIVRIYYKPYMSWIWYGCLLMAIGGLVAITDRRYRRRRAALQGEV